jgi:short-subunit dehydrogenase
MALNHELKRSNVDLLVLAPGPTRTEGAQNTAGIDFTRLPIPMASPKPVVSAALRSIGRKSLAIPGPVNKIMDATGKYLTPRPVLTRMIGKLTSRALTGDEPL